MKLFNNFFLNIHIPGSRLWLGLFFLLTIPAFTQAQTSDTFCMRLSDAYQRATVAAAAEEQKFNDNWEAQVSLLSQHQQERDVSLVESRQVFDQEQAARLDQLLSLAQSDSQKQAVTDFKKTQADALSDYRDAVDGAVKTFRNTTNTAISERRQSISDALMRFKNVVAAAASKASTDCSQGISPQTINSNFKNTVVAAQQQLTADRRGLQTISNVLKQASRERVYSLNSALKTFRTRVEDAGGKLQAAFQ